MSHWVRLQTTHTQKVQGNSQNDRDSEQVQFMDGSNFQSQTTKWNKKTQIERG